MAPEVLCEHLNLDSWKSTQKLYTVGSPQEIEKFLFENSLEQSNQFVPLKFYQLDSQPEPFQRKSYPNSKRKEFRYFKPHILKVTPLESVEHLIKSGTAIMQIVNCVMEPIKDEPAQVCEMNEGKSFCFNPTAINTSKGQQRKLLFTINFEMTDGEQKTEIIQSDEFRVVSRISECQRAQGRQL